MELLLNKSLLEELYNCRKEDFEELIYKKYRKKELVVSGVYIFHL